MALTRVSSSGLNTTGLMPAGAISYFATVNAPAGWLKSDGSAVSRTTYATLFAAIGTTFGAGNGSTTFNVPDLRDRMLVGSGNLYGLGATGGSKDAVLIYHTHTGGTSAAGDHSHVTYSASDSYGVGDQSTSWSDTGGNDEQTRYDKTSGATNTAGNHSHSFTTNQSGNSDGVNSNMPPYAGFLGCIKY